MSTQLDLPDIQGNLLRGYRFANARHFALGVTDAARAARFLGDLVSGSERRSPQITTAEHWQDDKPPYCLNVGLTYAGLQALGVPAGTLAAFPPAFQQGPAVRAAMPDPDFPANPRAVGLGDRGPSGPDGWVVGGPATPEVHILLSLYAERSRRLDAVSARLRKRFAATGVTEISAHDASALPGQTVHFGYRDGIAQPQIDGAPGRPFADMQPRAPAGDFLLGRDYVNGYGGNFIGDLPPSLADNATYAAFRIVSQDVDGFERLLTRWAEDWGLDRELVAAKLLGRWRNGTPLTLSPATDQPEPPLDEAHLNAFDYAPSPRHPAYFDDADGRRCPIGSHMRRMNPRSALVMGRPHSRRLVRRGMPYGPPYDPEHPDDGAERGLMGLFVCGDLELQYEFLLRVWANEDLATHGLRGTRDPIVGAQPPEGGHFTLRTDDGRDPIVLTGLTSLVTTRGSLYCFVPGIGGLRRLASQPAAAGA